MQQQLLINNRNFFYSVIVIFHVLTCHKNYSYVYFNSIQLGSKMIIISLVIWYYCYIRDFLYKLRYYCAMLGLYETELLQCENDYHLCAQ